MATLTAQPLVVAGLEPVLTAAGAGGDDFTTTGKQYLMIVNGDSSSHTATVNDPNSVGPDSAKQFNADVDIVVPAGETRIAGPFTAARFRDGADSKVHVTYSAVTSVEVALLQSA